MGNLQEKEGGQDWSMRNTHTRVCTHTHTHTNFRAEMAGGSGGRELPRQALGLGKGLKLAPCVKEANRDPCGI